MQAPLRRLLSRNAPPLDVPMAQVISFTPRRASPSGLLRAARERSGLSVEQFASRLGDAIGRPELGPGTIRAWESAAVPPPGAVLEAAQRVALPASTVPTPTAWSTAPSLVDG